MAPDPSAPAGATPNLSSIKTWSYRVILMNDVYSIREVYLDDSGAVVVVTEEGVYPEGDTLEELRQDLALYAQALDQPVIELKK